MTESEKYLITWIAATASIMAAVIGFNAWVDPMWIFEHSHRWNQNRILVNHRIQKINHLTFGDRDYDSVVIGSSRCTTLRESDFPSMRLFNFCMDSMYPDEFEGVLEVFSSLEGPPKNILIGMDFWTTSPRDYFKRPDPESFLQDAQSPLYRLRTLASFDTLEYSVRTVLLNIDPQREASVYDHDYTLTKNPMTAEAQAKTIRRQRRQFRQSFFGPDYVYRDTGPQALRRIQSRYPEAKLTVFIPPISAELYGELVASGRFDDYAYWLGDLVATGQNVIDMLGISDFSENPSNFWDADHIHSDRSDVIAKFIQSPAGGKRELGQLVTRNNLFAHISAQQQATQRVVLRSELQDEVPRISIAPKIGEAVQRLTSYATVASRGSADQ